MFKDYISSQTGGTANYTVVNLMPIVYGRIIVVRLMITCISPSASLIEVSNNLPITSRSVSGVLCDGSCIALPMRASFEADGKLKVQGGTAGKTFVGEVVAISALNI